jgi:hypothetical protein
MLDTTTVLTVMFTRIDDFCKQICKRKTGPVPKLSDSELITVALFSELANKNSDYQQVAFSKQWLKDYFPDMIDRSQYNRRLRSLDELINHIRVEILGDIIMEIADLHILDSTPIPVITFQRACYTPLFPEASFGYCAARKMTYYGFKFNLVTDTQGFPLHFDLMPANEADNQIAEELLSFASKDRIVLADKGYLSAERERDLLEKFNIDLQTPKRKNQRNRESKSERKLLNKVRQRIEVVNGILKDVFSFEKTYAKTLKGLATKIIKKMTAFTFGIYLNKLFGRNPLSIKSIVG